MDRTRRTMPKHDADYHDRTASGRSGWRWSAVVMTAALMAAGMIGPAQAHETDQYTTPIGRTFADLGPYFSRWVYGAIDHGCEKLNDRIRAHMQTTGAAEDLKHATEIAKRMVVEYGMSDSLGPINLGAERVNVFLGEEIVKSDEHSEELSAQVDKEIIKLLRQAYHRAKDLLVRNRQALDKLAQELLKREVLEGEEIDAALKDIALQPAT